MSEPEIPQTPEKRKPGRPPKLKPEVEKGLESVAVAEERMEDYLPERPARPALLERLASLPIERVGFIESVATGGVQFNSSGFQCIPQGAQTVPRDGTAEILPQGVLLSISQPGAGAGKQMFVPWSNVKFIVFVKAE